MAKPRLLVVDDEPDMADIVALVAERLGYEVAVAADAADFKEKCASLRPDCVVVDIVMPDVDGLELIDWLAGNHCEAGVVFVTGYAELYGRSAHLLADARQLKLLATLAKPLDLDVLRAVLRPGVRRPATGAA